MSEQSEAGAFPETIVDKENRTSRLLEKLKPQELVDEEGHQRTIFTFTLQAGNPVRVMFYSPEEMPYAKDAIENRQAFILGDEPQWRSRNEWQDFVRKVRDTAKFKFTPNNSLANIRREAVEKGEAVFLVEISGRGEEILDGIIAAKILDDKGNFRHRENYDGEALTVLSLLGDEEATAIVEEKRIKLQQYGKTRNEERINSQRKKAEQMKVEPLKLPDLVAVHLTNYPPKRTADGKLKIMSTFDATKWKTPPNTVHFSLNHPVRSHLYGGWEEATYGVIAPLEQIIEINGPQTVLGTVDTFFEVSPGNEFEIRGNSRIVRPGNPTKFKEGELFKRINQSEVIYKSSQLTSTDRVGILNRLTDFDKNKLNDRLAFFLTDRLTYTELKRAMLKEVDLASLRTVLGVTGGEIRDLLAMMATHEPRDAIKAIYKQAGILDKLPNRLVQRVVVRVERALVAEVRNLAIREEIIDMGYKSKAGGMWAWRGEGKVTNQTYKLAAEIGAEVAPHTEHITYKISSAVYDAFNYLTDKELSITEKMEEYHRVIGEIRQKLILQTSQKSRRMLYLAELV